MDKIKTNVFIVSYNYEYFTDMVDLRSNDIQLTVSDDLEVLMSKRLNEDIAVVIIDQINPNLKILELTKKITPHSQILLCFDKFTLSEAIEAVNRFQIFKLLDKTVLQANDLNESISLAIIYYHERKKLTLDYERIINGFLYIPLDILHSQSSKIFELAIDMAKFSKSHNSKLPIIDLWSFEVSCLIIFWGSLNYNIHSIGDLYHTPNLIKVIKRTVSLVASIPPLDKVRRNLSEIVELYEYDQKVINLSRDSQTLKLVIDYFILKNMRNFHQEIIRLYSVDIVKYILSISEKSITNFNYSRNSIS